MGFSFLNPLLLAGLAAAAIPLVVHLFNRKRAKPHAFAAIDFVLRSRRETARRLRLRRILLFASRTLLLLALPLALARPLVRKSEAALLPQGPQATAIVLDTSLSMRYRLEGEPLFERAQSQARDALNDLGPEDPATFIRCDRDAPPPEAPSFDRLRIREAIDAARPSFFPIDLNRCLVRATRALGESPVPGKRLVLVSDLTVNAFPLEGAPPTVTTPQGEVHPEVLLFDAAGGASELPNRALIALKVEPAPALGSRAFQFTTTLANYASRGVSSLPVSLKIGNDVVAKGFVDLPPHGTAVKTLTYRFPAGGSYTGAVSLPEDGLAADDVRPFALEVPREVKALIVDGSPHSVRMLDEAFFVETALSSAGSLVQPTSIDADALTPDSWAGYDVVLLLNVRELPADRIDALTTWVRKGGGLFISLGDQVDADRYNTLFAPLLPRPLHLVKTATERRDDGADSRAAHLAQVEFEHPAFQVFADDAREGLLSARTYRYFLLAPGAASEAGGVAFLASYDDGAPALVEARRGRGRVILYTSTVDRDWTDWPIRTSFLPTIQRLSAYLAGVLEERTLEEIRVGEPKTLHPPEGATAVTVKTPGGESLRVDPDGEGNYVFGRTERPGIYPVSAQLQGVATTLASQTFTAQLDPRESDLSRVDEKELKEWFGVHTRTEQGVGRLSTDEQGGLSGFPFWSLLLALGVLLFFAEGALARK